MDFLVFGDESGTTGSDRCYSIGLLCVPKEKINEFNEYVLNLKTKRGIVGELKWSRLRIVQDKPTFVLTYYQWSCAVRAVFTLSSLKSLFTITGK